MKRFSVLVLILILGMFLVACSPEKESLKKATGAEDIGKVTKPSTIEISGTEESSVVEIDVIAKQWEFEPNPIKVSLGDTVVLNIESVDVMHGFVLSEFGVSERLSPGKKVRVEFLADKTGEFPFFCSVPCGAGHGSMRGTLIVE